VNDTRLLHHQRITLEALLAIFRTKLRKDYLQGPNLDQWNSKITMAEQQPAEIVEGATTGDVEDEIPQIPKSAEDRKAAAALSSLDAPRDDDQAGTKDIDQEAVKKAMDRLASGGVTTGGSKKKADEKKEVKKIVKVDPSDVALVVRRH
jgi:hypothetical protein